MFKRNRKFNSRPVANEVKSKCSSKINNNLLASAVMEKENNKQESDKDAVYVAQILSHKKENVDKSWSVQPAQISGHEIDVCHVGGGECYNKPEDLNSEDSGCDPTGDAKSDKAQTLSFGDMEDTPVGTRPKCLDNRCDGLHDEPDKIIHDPDSETTQTLVHNNKDKPVPTVNVNISRVLMEKSEPKSCTWPVMKGLMFPLVGLLIYFWDIGSDIRLAVDYKKNGDMIRFGITVGCIVIPHVIMAVVDVSWAYIDRRKQKSNECMDSWDKRFVLGLFTLGRIVRSVTYMHHVYEAKKLPKEDSPTRQTSLVTKDQQNVSHVSNNGSYTLDNSPEKLRKWHKARAREEKRDCFMLDSLNAFAESAPQLFVQLYLYYRYDLPLTRVRVLNLLSSWVSIAWTYAAYYRSNREALHGREDVNFVGFVFFFGAFLAALAARAISIVLFLVYWSVRDGVIFAGIHFLVMLFWISCKEKPKLEGTTTGCWRYLYYVFFAYVCILGFTNLRDSETKVRMTVFYGLMYAENIVLALLTFLKMREIGDIKYASHFVVLFIGFIIHVVLLINYYIFLHPKTGQSSRRNM